jgi:DNA mismatch repair ATPase MutS
MNYGANMIREEELHQSALVRWFNLRFGSEIGRLFYHIPNGGHRNIKEAMKFKSVGVKSGVCDLFLSIPNSKYHGLYIEMKSTKGKLTPNQYKFINLVKEKGYDVFICKDWEKGKEYILEYLNG